MTEPTPDSRKAKLAANARPFKYDAQLERALELFRTDRAAFDRLPRQIKGQAGVYADFRQHYSDAVEAGAVPDDRSGPPPAA